MTIIEIANKIKEAKGTLYLVGGAIRDELLGKICVDEDYCVVGLNRQEFQQLFPTAISRGHSFEVFDLENKEFALARTEEKSGIGHKEFNISTGKNITIEEDLARRDITINSIAKNVLTGEIIDPFNGRTDIKNRIIRATTKAFNEDPLRVYRVARFASELQFEVEKKTLKLMNDLQEELNILSKERVFAEFKKALLSKNPSIFFNVLRDAGVLKVHFKEIFDLIGVLQPEKYHPEGDAYNHTMEALERARILTSRAEFLFSVLVHDLGKGVTPKEQYPHHYQHDKNGAELVKKLGNRVGVPNIWLKCGKIATRQHMRAGIFYEMKPRKQVELLEALQKSMLGLDGMEIVVLSDSRRKINFVELGTQMLKEINGNMLKEKYGLEEGIRLKNRLTEERAIWIKNKLKL